MKIGLIGYGNMGKEIARIAKERGHEITAIVDPAAKEATAKAIDAAALKDVDVCIDFSAPATAIENIEKVAALKKNLVVGTTGWYENVESARKTVAKHGIGFLYSSNFSVGVNAFYRIVARAAEVMNRLKEYDAYGYELHHNRKADSPSGTAKSLAQVLLKHFTRKKKAVYEMLDRKIGAEELHFASVRGGSIPGTHVIGFDSAVDGIELKHEARSRAGFALGAVMGAEWVKGKKGFFGADDFMNDLLGGM